MNKPTYDFLEHLRLDKNYSEQTINSYKFDIEKFFKFLNKEGVLMDQVDQIVIRNFLTDELNAGISKRSCKRRLSSLNQFYSFLTKEEMVKDNPFILVDSPKTDKKYPHVLYKDEVRDILNANALRTDELAIRDQAILCLLYFCGLRAAELVGLNVQDVNIRNRMVVVFGKGRKERLVPFTEECRVAVKRYLDELRPKLVNKQKNATSALFLGDIVYKTDEENPQKEPRMTTRGLEYILDQIEEKTGIYKEIHPHILRHSFATHLLENGADLKVIQELLGHTSINATQVYTHVSPEAMKQTYIDSFPRARKKEDDK